MRRTFLIAAALSLLAAPAQASLDGWFAAGRSGLDGKPLAELSACGGGGATVRESFKAFAPGQPAAAAELLDAGKCDVALSGTPGSTTRKLMEDTHPSRWLYEIQGGRLKQLRAGSDLPPWFGLAKAGRAEVALGEAVLCGTGPWRDLYRKKVKSAANVHPVAERLSRVDGDRCDLAVFSHEEFAALGGKAAGYARFGLYADGARPAK